MYDFETGPEWQEVRLDLAEVSPNVDWKRVRAIGVGTMGPVGPFRFQIDDVRAGVRSRPDPTDMRLKQLLQNIRNPPPDSMVGHMTAPTAASCATCRS